MALRKIATIAYNCPLVVHVYRDAEWDEYRVRVEGSGQHADYHTDSKTDAMQTARCLAKGLIAI